MACWAMLRDTVDFYRTLVYYWWTNGTFEDCPYFQGRDQARCQLYSFAITLGYLWDKPHYRAASLAEDMRINFRNVAVPGTGLSLDHVVCCRTVAVLYMLLIYPLLCLISAIHLARGKPAQGPFCSKLTKAYCEQLVNPQHWFSYWRLNSFLAALHSYETKAEGFKQEDKWTFLVDGERAGVPVSPYLKVESIVCKDRFEEGGMGLFFFRNATVGGKWIIQERLHNAKFIKALLPANAPLSTFRVMTTSRGGLTPHTPRLGRARTKHGFSSLPEGHISAVSCVFRAGRLGANTDHDSILFDVDKATGTINRGTRNMHWYQLGLQKALACPWSSQESYSCHPDGGKDGTPLIEVQGKVVPNIRHILEVTCLSHYLLVPDVPIVGWDVCLTDQGICMLEINLSCNFFKGSFDVDAYFRFMTDYFKYLDTFRIAKREKES